MSIQLKVGQTVFFVKTEQYWDKPYVMKRHHVYDTRSVTLRGRVTDIHGDEFKAHLTGNNGFEKDEQEFVFHKNSLLSNQDFKDVHLLGIWSNAKVKPTKSKIYNVKPELWNKILVSTEFTANRTIGYWEINYIDFKLFAVVLLTGEKVYFDCFNEDQFVHVANGGFYEEAPDINNKERV